MLIRDEVPLMRCIRKCPVFVVPSFVIVCVVMGAHSGLRQVFGNSWSAVTVVSMRKSPARVQPPENPLQKLLETCSCLSAVCGEAARQG